MNMVVNGIVTTILVLIILGEGVSQVVLELTGKTSPNASDRSGARYDAVARTDSQSFFPLSEIKRNDAELAHPHREIRTKKDRFSLNSKLLSLQDSPKVS